jgi:Na+-transporting NADH:ubiquinone oxidoreductase subunit C
VRQGNLYTILFVIVVAFCSALLLSGTSRLLSVRQAQNAELDRKSNILSALGFPLEKGNEFCVTDPETGKEMRLKTLQCYGKFVKETAFNSRGDVVTGMNPGELSLEAELSKPADKRTLPVFIRMDSGRPAAYCVPVYGKGLWAAIYGYIALEPDLNTIRGVTFYKHGETPGLGAEIEAESFRGGFKGKKIYSQTGELVSVRVVKGGVKSGSSEAEHEVDGITSATITGEAVARLIKHSLDQYEPGFKKMRGGGAE